MLRIWREDLCTTLSAAGQVNQSKFLKLSPLSHHQERRTLLRRPGLRLRKVACGVGDNSFRHEHRNEDVLAAARSTLIQATEK